MFVCLTIGLHIHTSTTGLYALRYRSVKKSQKVFKEWRLARRIIEKELEGCGIRLNKKKPDIKLLKKDKGGISINVRARTGSHQKRKDFALRVYVVPQRPSIRSRLW